MKYLYFDVECISCKGGTGKLCSFGYVLTDEQFNIIDKDDIIINPNLPRKDYDWFVVKKMLSYTLNEIESKPNFEHHYQRIKNLLTNPEHITLGFDVVNDLQYINDECIGYNLTKLDIKSYDVQDFYKQYSGERKRSSLSKLVEILEVSCDNLSEHNSRDDSEMTMLVAKTICEKLSLTLTDVMAICDKSIMQIKERTEKSPRSHSRSFAKELKNLAEQYPERKTYPMICLSDTIKETDAGKRLQLIKVIFDHNYNYGSKVSECSIYVANDEIGERDLSYAQNIKEGKIIKKINIKDLSELLGVDIDENGEIYEQEKYINSPIMLEFQKACEKAGMTLEEFMKNVT